MDVSALFSIAGFMYIKRLALAILGFAIVLLFAPNVELLAQQPGFQNGVKIGEVTPTSAIIWTRLTSKGKPVHSSELNTIGPEVPGLEGIIKLTIWSKNSERKDSSTLIGDVDASSDFTYQFKITDLQPGTKYGFRLSGGNGKTEDVSLEGSFTTAPDPGKSTKTRFAVITGQGYHCRDDGANGHKIFKHMLNSELDFFVHTGDIVYYDRPNPKVNDLSSARRHWHRMYCLPNQLEFHRRVPSYFIKDDHDTLNNDCWPGMKPTGEFTFDMGKAVFVEQVPMGKLTYRTFRWGKDVQIWLMEGRDYRSVNRDPDGPHKTIWGKEQISWLKNTVAKSDASFKIIISPTPIVGPDRKNKNDNHANDGFKTEGQWARKWLKDNGFIVICGDRHWQYVSQDPETGLTEFATGPSSDRHAGGFKQANRTDAHKYLRVKGGYFVAEVEVGHGGPTFTGIHYSADGIPMNTFRLGKDLEKR